MTAIEKKIQELGMLLCKELVKQQAITGDIGLGFQDLAYNNGGIEQQIHKIVSDNFYQEEFAYKQRMANKKKLFPNDPKYK
jgi:hypothetical protein